MSDFSVHKVSVQMGAATTTVTKVPDPDSYDKGHEAGYTEGYGAGKSDGYSEGHGVGYAVGYGAGKSDGYSEGHQAGYTEGYDVGKSAGYTEGHDAGYNEGHSAGESEGYEAGKKSEYDMFWDTFQQNGATNFEYSHRFRWGWYDANFKPKYDIKPTKAENMFSNSRITNIKASLEACGVVLDLSNATATNSCFGYTQSTELPVLDTTKSTSLYGMLADNANLVSVDKFIFGTANKYTTNFVRGCSNLVNFPAEGTIAITGFDFSPCTKLSGASIYSIMNCLSKTTSGMTITFSKTAVTNAWNGGDDSIEWRTIISEHLNWTVSLV